MNQSLQTITDMKAKHVLFILNDKIPDGLDVSWIWDIDIEQFVSKFQTITVSGDRTYDMALRMHYAEMKNVVAEPVLKNAIKSSLENLKQNETLYILPTYSAMLDTRKILTGKKIL